MTRLLVTEGQIVTAQAEFNGIAQWGASDHFDIGTVAEAHFQKPASDVLIAAYGKDATLAANAKLV